MLKPNGLMPRMKPDANAGHPQLTADAGNGASNGAGNGANNGASNGHSDATSHCESNVIQGLAAADLDNLLHAVADRLKIAVAQRQISPFEFSASIERIGATVLECVAVLEQLRSTEIDQRQRLEFDLLQAQLDLVQARTDLAGTQAGERRARHQALHDGLTLLPNRELFRQRLDLALARADAQQQAGAVLYVDLDDFKLINDTHGHEAGDELLKAVAARLAGAVRADDLVSRLGGDEFACLLAQLPPGRVQLGRLASKLVDAVSAPFKIGTLQLSVRPSIGISRWPDDGGTGAELLKCADAAMYRAKRQHTGYAFFDANADA